MSDKLRAVRARFHNIFQFEEFEFDMGQWTMLTGPNKVGKTNALEAIRSLWEGETHDVRLLRKGQKEGEVSLLLSDGVELIKRTLEGKTFLVVRVPKIGDIKRAPSYVKGLLGELSLNPIEFITAKPARQKELFLRAIPMQITREQLTAAVGFAMTQPVEGHALDVIASAEKMFFDDRTTKNRDLKRAQSAAQQIRASLPKAPPTGDWAQAVKETEDHVRALDAELSRRQAERRHEAVEKIAELTRDVAVQVAELRRVAQERIREIEQGLAQNIEGTRAAAAQTDTATGAWLAEVLANIEKDVRPQLQEWSQKAEHARTMRTQHLEAASARKLLAQFETEASELAEEAQELTQGLEGLRQLRASLTAELPITGVEIGPEELMVDGIPISRTEESRKIKIAVELALLGAGELGLVMVDGLEALDDVTLALFKREIATYGAQVLGTRVVTPDPARPETQGLLVEREG